jgi:hypothetical protein
MHIGRKLVVADRHTPTVLDLVEEALDRILRHGTTRYVPKADRLLIKGLGFVWMEIMYDSRLQPIAADVSGWPHGAPASACGDACKGAFSKVAPSARSQ